MSEQCPKCGAPRPAGATECPQCGIIYARFEQGQARRQEETRAAMMMACPACGKTVSRQARACPECGQPIAEVQQTRTKPAVDAQDEPEKLSPVIIYGGGFILLVVILCMLGTMFSGKTDTSENEQMRTMMADAERKIRQQTRIVSIKTNTLGCHDLDDFMQLETIARSGNKARFRRTLGLFRKEERCDFVQDRVVTAFFDTDPSGMVQIKDSEGSLWWIDPTRVEE